MPPRRKPISGKQKKEQQQLKRAIKRGDVPPPDPTLKKPSRKRRMVKIGPTGQVITPSPHSLNQIASAKKLQSAFIKLPPKFLEETKAIASSVPLDRPISYDVALFHDFAADAGPVTGDTISCPKRPKWNFEMSKIEVEHNEEGVFKKWLAHTDQLIEEWQKSKEPVIHETNDDETPIEKPLTAPPSPTYFERNLEVWRQLWRVTEISQIILVLLDSRCPLLHFPPSLSDYLSNRKVILVLTKADITGPIRVSEWMKYFNTRYPGFKVVQVESYIEKEVTTVHQGKVHYEPHLPETFRQRLVETIKEVHAEMLQPPPKVASNPKWLKTWIPPVKREIDWAGVLRADGSQVGIAMGGATVPKPKDDEKGEVQDGLNEKQEPDLLTIGLIGQPNVGKSSLLNALFGARRVRASKTPGKTKHFQTLFWTSDVRLVDCPGLVMPNYVPMEMQVLSGILPISKVSAIPACINYVSKLIPLERVFKLSHPSASEPLVEDKRTWREGMEKHMPKPLQWTAMDILVAYANMRGWVTAKAGRPDIHRAGNAILRAVAEGRISWAFWPLNSPLDLLAKESTEIDTGIWIPGHDRELEDEDNNEESGQEDVQDEEEESEGLHSESEDEDDLPSAPVSRFGAFGALQINEGENEEEEDDKDDDGDDK